LQWIALTMPPVEARAVRQERFMCRLDLPCEDPIVEECLTSVAFLVEETGLDAALGRLGQADGRPDDSADSGSHAI